MSMSKPIPSKKGISQLFWESLQKEKFLIQSCNACKRQIFYPRILCPHCGDDSLEYLEHSGEGEIYSYSIIHKSNHPAFKKEVPYIIALINLQGGGKMMSRIVYENITNVKIGAAVKVLFEKIDDETTLPYFELY